MATDQRTPQEAPKPKPETTAKKTRERKSHKGSNQKKIPQRGMGVEQLERLRIEERMKKLADPLNLPDHYHFQKVHTTALSVSNPLSSVPLHYGAANYGAANYGGGGPVVVNSSGSGLFGVDRASFVVQRISGNGGFSCGSSGVKVVGGMVMKQVMVDPNPYGVGAPDQRVQVGSVYETSKELSSMPKMQSIPSDRCDTCRKKKRFNWENKGVHGGKDKCSEMLPISSATSYFGLKAETIPTFAGNHTLGFGARASGTGYVGRSLDNQGVEVIAIHRKGNTSSRGVMEYDFFPADNKQELGGGGSSSSSEASDAIDLSLKLSY